MTKHTTPAAELHANVSVPFNQARAMPKSVYTSAEFLALEQAHVFAKDWICAGRAETLPNPGDYLTLQIADEPVIVPGASTATVAEAAAALGWRVSRVTWWRMASRTLRSRRTMPAKGISRLRKAPAARRRAS